MQRRPLLLALCAFALTAGTGIPAMIVHERGYWADRPLRADPVRHPSRFTPADARALRPGQYRWAPYVGDAGPVHIAIDLTSQRAYVFQGEALIGIAAVSTGRSGHGTPTGSFPILEKAVWHRSNLYSNAPMPYMQRLTWGGIALHAGYDPGRPASHGCIRMPYGFARILFRATRVGAMVVVTRGAPASAPPLIEQEQPLRMASAVGEALPAAGPPTAPEPGRRVALMSTDRAIAYVTATML